MHIIFLQGLYIFSFVQGKNQFVGFHALVGSVLKQCRNSPIIISCATDLGINNKKNTKSSLNSCRCVRLEFQTFLRLGLSVLILLNRNK